MRSKTLRRLGALVLGTSLVATTVVASTMAKYTSTSSSNEATVEVAKWSVSVNDTAMTDQFTLTLVPDKQNEVSSGKIAPGVNGSFTIEIDNASEVDIGAVVTFVADNVPTNLTFSVGGTTLTAENGTYTAKTFTSIAKETGTDSVTVNWTWAYGTDKESDQDDIATGDYDMKVTATVVATQVDPGNVDT